MRVGELVPGMVVMGATFVARTEHPLFPGLALVVWRMPDGGWSHDALAWRQEIGEPDVSDAQDRVAALRRALLGTR